MAKKDLIAKIILKGETDPSLQKAFTTASKLADKNIDKLKQYGTVATKAMKVAGAAAVTGLAASAKAAIDYESAFAGVMKTVNETGTTTYADLSEQIRQMAKEMPASAAQIAGVAEMAGQLGIKADDIMGFTKTMIDLGETTNLSSDEAASAIAKFFNITGTAMSDVDKFGSTLVHLGNNAATTEADIMAMASRIASSGNQIGLTEPQVLALATSLSSVGIEAEAGGTAISTVMTKIDKSVALNDKTLSTWADTAGMSVSNFKKMWESDAYGALQKVIGGMGDVKKEGGNLNLVLEELGITGIREADTMKRLSSASEMMSKTTELASKAWGENSALTEEAGKRYATMASRIQMMKNRLYDVGITVGEAVMPHMEKLMTALEKVDWNSFANKIAGAINWIAQHSTTLITIIGAIGGAIAALKILNFVQTIISVISFLSKMAKTFGLVKVALAALGGPVTIVIAIIGLLVGAFIALWTKCEGFRNFWIGLWEKVKTTATKAASFIKDEVLAKIGELPSKILAIGGDIVKGLWKGITGAKDWLVGKVGGFIDGVVEGFTDGFEINSPSVVMAKLGKFLPMGLGVGIVDNAKYALDAVKKVGTKVIGAASKISPTIGVKAAELTSTASNINYGNIAQATANGGKNIIERGISGVSKSGGGNSVSFTFAPVINGGNAEENRKMLKDEQAEFEKRMEVWMKKKGRVAFA